MGFGDGGVGRAKEPWMRRMDVRERVMAGYNAVMFCVLCVVILGLAGMPEDGVANLGWVFAAWGGGVPLAWLASGLWAPSRGALPTA